MTTLVLKNAAAIYSDATDNGRLSDGYVVVRDGRIAETGHGVAPAIDAADVIDCSGCIVLPGLINLHHHFFQAVTRALPTAHTAASAEWLRLHYPIWACMNPDDLATAVRNAAAELVLSGATSSVDHAFMLGGARSALPEIEIAAACDIGLRLHLVRGCLPTIGGETEAYLRKVMGSLIDTLITPTEGLAAQCRADVKRWHDGSFGSMLQIALGPSNVPYSRPDILSDLSRVAEETGCGLHMHFHPRNAERVECSTQNGCTPAELLARTGWLRPKSWFAHCTELDDDEIARFADTGTGVAHCPRTVLRLGYHVPRIAAMRDRGVRVGFGVDGAASNDGGSFISDLRLGMVLHRCREQNAGAWLTPIDALRMATSDAATILGRSDIGTLTVGACADIAIFKLDGVALGGALNDPLGGFLLAGVGSRAFATIINGRVIVRDGRLATADEERLAVTTHDASYRLLARAQGIATR